MTPPCPRLAVMLALPCLLLVLPARAEAPPGAAEFFETKVRPVLAQHCLSCHGADKARAGLRLDSRARLLRGGDRGPAVVPGDPDRSLLLQAVRRGGDLKMPPREPLGPREIADLTAWVQWGAPWPDAAAAGPDPGWAFQPVRNPAVPLVKDTAWLRSPLDCFILSKLEANGLRPAAPADRRTLIRRVTFDLIGLPPPPQEVEAFVCDDAPDAYERLIDRLLASPAYGERWGRHWLDLARYADSNGLDENTTFGNAWRYRDYVIAAFNRDEPYDLFIIEQLAGDLLPPDRDPTVSHERLTATGFLVLGPKLLAEPDKQKLLMDLVDEQIEVTTRAFLGLTVACARCHDHKFDPVTQRDYYALAGIFKSTRTLASLGTVARALERPLGARDAADRALAFGKLVRAKQEELRLARDETARARLRQELDALERTAPPAVPMALAVQDQPRPENCRLHLRGNHLTLGDEIPRHFVQAIAGDQQTPVPAGHSGRLELARWLASPDNPLTARVLVNRVWMHHCGEGLVRSVDNFGRLGDRPTHPELLDWLALRFLEGGWSIKALHRLILLSSAYRMSTTFDAGAAEADPDNRLLWRQNRRRLQAEPLRDALLAVCGRLDRTMGGSLLTAPNFAPVTEDASGAAGAGTSPRRSVYLSVIRNAVCDVFEAFDFGDPHVSTGRRASTTVAPQALLLLNSPLAREQARAFASRLLAEPDDDDASRVGRAYVWAYGRQATADEVRAALAFVRAFADRSAVHEPDPERRRLDAWAAFCQAVFASNEFLYLE